PKLRSCLRGCSGCTANSGVPPRAPPAALTPPLAQLNAVLPPESKVLLVGQAAVFHLDHFLVYNTVFNHETIETVARDRSPDQVRQALRERGLTHGYVDWPGVARPRPPARYGF